MASRGVGDPISVIVKGTKETRARIDVMQREVDLGTIAALKKVQGITRSSIRSNMRGRPRWDHRGASSRTGAAIDLGLSPHHVTKSGGPGKLSGSLYSSIRRSRKPRRETIGTYSAVVMSGGAGKVQNLYKGKIEAQYPFFGPGVLKAEPKMPAVWNAAWAKATRTKK